MRFDRQNNLLTGQAAAARRRVVSSIAFSLIAVQGLLLGYSACSHSPTQLEPAFLASGVSHWLFGRFELYRVNPPLVRLIAAVPAIVIGCETNWSRFHDSPGARPEFQIGEDFLQANGPNALGLIVYARWACIPLALLGSYVAFIWSKHLYGSCGGLLTLTLYVFDPNLLAHGALITPDIACTSFGLLAAYSFSCWLRRQTWWQAAFAATTLSLAIASKSTWIILFLLWPALGGIWHAMSYRRARPRLAMCDAVSQGDRKPLPFLQLVAITLSPLYAICALYLFDGVFTRLKDYSFVSQALSSGVPFGNRFQDSIFGNLPVPLPEQYVLGLDLQQKDFEGYGQPSYLRGEWKHGGWWYYYIYGLLVKSPCGILALFAAAIGIFIVRLRTAFVAPDELVLIATSAIVLLVVSMHLAFNHHLRYALPSLGLCYVLVGSCATLLSPLTRVAVATFAASAVVSSLLSYPHHISYFNEMVGGPRNGSQQLLGSSFDWQQDWLYVLKACRASTNPESYLTVGISPAYAAAIGVIPADRVIPYAAFDGVAEEGQAPPNVILSLAELSQTERGRQLIHIAQRPFGSYCFARVSFSDMSW